MDLSELLSTFGLAVEKGTEEGASSKEEKELNLKLMEFHSLLKNLASNSVADEGGPENTQNRSLTVREMTESHAQKIVNHCKTLLSCSKVKDSTKALAAQLCAEIARCGLGRTVLRREAIVVVVTKVLQEPCPLETTVQICRILGNLCYESRSSRQQILDTPDCLQSLYTIVSNREKAKSDDPGQILPVILPGFLSNFCNDSPEFVQKIGEIGFVDTVVKNVLSTTTNDAVFSSSLSFLVCLSECSVGMDIFKEKTDVSPAIRHILDHTTSPEVTRAALEVVRFLVDNPVLSTRLAESGLCDTIVARVLGRWGSKGFEVHRINGCNLLVNIMYHDDAMKYLYALDGGRFRDLFLDWLREEETEMKLKVTAALAVGNFACNEEYSQTLVENGTSKLLIELLKKHQNPIQDMELQHALLGTLRNLAVYPGSRAQLVSEGVVDLCAELTGKLSLTSFYSVISQLVPVVRLVVDGNKDVSLRVGKNRSLLSKYVEWGTRDNQWLKAATGHLLATIVKNSQSSEVMSNIVEVGGMPLITVMLASEHGRMLNEALIALILMATALPADVVVAQLYTDLIINGLKTCLNDTDHPVKVKKNALTLLGSLLKVRPHAFKTILMDMDFMVALEHESIKDLPETLTIVNSINSY